MESNKERLKDSFVKLSRTDKDQKETETAVLKFLKKANFNINDSENFNGEEAEYLRELHFNYIRRHLHSLPHYYKSSDTGMPWFAYWILNVLEMTKGEYEIDYNTKLQIVNFLKQLQDPEGGFRGMPRGISHLVSTYAAVMAIVNLGIEEGYKIINIPKMKQYLLRMKNNNFKINQNPSFVDKNGIYLVTREKENNCSNLLSTYPGAFSNHDNGESDLRSTFCAISVASMLNLLDNDENNPLNDGEITKGVAEHIKKCQTYEGGFGPEPFCEGHGGYSYCAIATLVLLKRLNIIDINSFLRWLTNRQMNKEGGFNGRTNKLVDSCYSFWQGSIFNMLYEGNNNLTIEKELLYDQLALQAYILIVCQERNRGGLYDKPGKSPDIFHTNYASAGLSCSQFSLIKDNIVSLSENLDNELNKVNPLYGANAEKVIKAKNYFKNLNNA
ncbi:MAG: protein farnesyltransferase subunit beta [archaeon]|nr:protein farnesyltransferase subunit beta [archaeon]